MAGDVQRFDPFDMATGVLAAFGATLADVVDMTTFIAGDLAAVYGSTA